MRGDCPSALGHISIQPADNTWMWYTNNTHTDTQLPAHQGLRWHTPRPPLSPQAVTTSQHPPATCCEGAPGVASPTPQPQSTQQHTQGVYVHGSSALRCIVNKPHPVSPPPPTRRGSPSLCGITLAAAPPVARRTLLIQGSPPRLLTEGCSLLLLLRTLLCCWRHYCTPGDTVVCGIPPRASCLLHLAAYPIQVLPLARAASNAAALWGETATATAAAGPYAAAAACRTGALLG